MSFSDDPYRNLTVRVTKGLGEDATGICVECDSCGASGPHRAMDTTFSVLYGDQVSHVVFSHKRTEEDFVRWQ